MKKTRKEIAEAIPLYPVLSSLVIDYLEPCLDYSVPRCEHKIAFCLCGNSFMFRSPLYPLHARTKRVLMEKFCPICGSPNFHESPDSPKWLRHGWRMDARVLPCSENPRRRLTKKYLSCSKCRLLAEASDHTYCMLCQARLRWTAKKGCFQTC